MAVNAQRERVSAAPVGMFARLTTETKHAFKTTEFWAMVAIVVGILIASWIVDDGAAATRSRRPERGSTSRSWRRHTSSVEGWRKREATSPTGLTAETSWREQPRLAKTAWRAPCGGARRGGTAKRGREHEDCATTEAAGTDEHALTQLGRRLDCGKPSFWARSAAVSNRDARARAERLAIFVGLWPPTFFLLERSQDLEATPDESAAGARSRSSLEPMEAVASQDATASSSSNW